MKNVGFFYFLNILILGIKRVLYVLKFGLRFILRLKLRLKLKSYL